ncbi:MAG TPA: hypothetical protein VHZ96_18275 [Frankiaceae bacterium]|jgi:hypothetical protein|nr:hypothetical protein [Frankiaceae bacterium]
MSDASEPIEPVQLPPVETPPLPRTVDSDAAAEAFTGILDSDSTPEEVEEVVSFIAAVPLGVRRTAPRWVAPVFAAGALVLVPWIIFLGFALPERSTDQHYNLAWVGFDLLLLFAMTRTALLAWKGRRQVQLPAAATATLLLVDAWFDILTSNGPWAITQALVLACLLELPIAVMAVWIARNVDKVVERAEHRLAEQAQQLLATHLLSGTHKVAREGDS